MKKTLYETVGGLAMLQKVHKIFYDKVYAHEWIGKFFEGHDQAAIENRQTSFMAEKMGGPDPYLGKELKMVHEAMYITDELFQLRKELLDAALMESGVDEVSRERWLKIDSAFRKQITKSTLESMYEHDWQYKKPIIIPKPETTQA